MRSDSEDPFNGKYYQFGRTLNSPQRAVRRRHGAAELSLRKPNPVLRPMTPPYCGRKSAKCTKTSKAITVLRKSVRERVVNAKVPKEDED